MHVNLDEGQKGWKSQTIGERMVAVKESQGRVSSHEIPVAPGLCFLIEHGYKTGLNTQNNQLPFFPA